MTALHDPRSQKLFPALPEATLEELAANGEVLDLPDGAELFREGQRDYPFYAVLEGEVQVVKRFGQETRLLANHSRGHFAGEISMLTGAEAIATGLAHGPVRVVRMSSERFREFAASDCPSAKMVLQAMAGRTKDVEAQTRQQDKLAALGKLSAGLAHELNNPASAARRNAQQLGEAFARLEERALAHDTRFPPEARAVVSRLASEAAFPPLDSLERSDREETLAEWLEEFAADQAWDLAPALTAAGYTVEGLRDLSGEPWAAAAAEWLAASAEARQLARDLEESTRRISELVAAMKDYTYMDRSDFQDTRVQQGLESTLRVFASRFREARIEVTRQFAPDLPAICAHPGELNQVWTNLIDNAVDAMEGGGRLTVSTRPGEGKGVVVEISDTGAGIPADVQERIFDPFFTTKPVGEGTGLGLDIVYRIVSTRHGGTIRVDSQPGRTTFTVTLPPNPPKENSE